MEKVLSTPRPPLFKNDAEKGVFRTRVDEMKKSLYPRGDWPEYLMPEPLLENLLTMQVGMTEASSFNNDFHFLMGGRKRQEGSLLPVVRVKALSTLLRRCTPFLRALESRSLAAQDCPLRPEAFRMVLEGYLVLLIHEAKFVFGTDAAMVTRWEQILQRFRVRCGREGSKSFRSKSFGRNFDRFQDELMQWIKVPTTLALRWENRTQA